MTHDIRGTTLIELMAAMFVLSVVLLSSLAFATANVRNESIGVARLRATNIAREGAEVARAIRDSNWLAGDPWNKGLFPPSGWQDASCAILHEVGVKTATFDFTTDAQCAQNLTDPPYQMYRKEDTGLFYQNAGAPADLVPRMFRKIALNYICVDAANKEISCNGKAESDAIGVTVTSEVSSLVRGKPVVNAVVEKLYNWK